MLRLCHHPVHEGLHMCCQLCDQKYSFCCSFFCVFFLRTKGICKPSESKSHYPSTSYQEYFPCKMVEIHYWHLRELLVFLFSFFYWVFGTSTVHIRVFSGQLVDPLQCLFSTAILPVDHPGNSPAAQTSLAAAAPLLWFHIIRVHFFSPPYI